MNGNEHGRAMDLLTQRDIEGIAETDARWLESHLAECEECASYEMALGSAEQAMRSFTVMASASLVASTQSASARPGAAVARTTGAHGADRGFVLPGRGDIDLYGLGVVEVRRDGSPSGWDCRPASSSPECCCSGCCRRWRSLLLLALVPPARFEGSIMQRFLNDSMGGKQ